MQPPRLRIPRPCLCAPREAQVSTRILGRRTVITPFLIPNRVPHGFTQEPSTDGLTCAAREASARVGAALRSTGVSQQHSDPDGNAGSQCAVTDRCGGFLLL